MPTASLAEAFEQAGGAGKPRVGQRTWADSVPEARAIAHTWWPQPALPGRLATRIERPRDFEPATPPVSDGDVAGAVVCTDSVDDVMRGVRRFAAAGYSRVHVHQVGPDQPAFLDRCRGELLPALEV